MHSQTQKGQIYPITHEEAGYMSLLLHVFYWYKVNLASLMSAFHFRR